jgi:hypothetical protein
VRGTTTTTFLLGGCRSRGGRAVTDKFLCLCGGPLRHQLRVGEANKQTNRQKVEEEGEFKHFVDSGALHLLLLLFDSGARVRAYQPHAHCTRAHPHVTRPGNPPPAPKTPEHKHQHKHLAHQ